MGQKLSLSDVQHAQILALYKKDILNVQLVNE